ncbi:MAG: ribosome biogenesis/translation initiation ATPase RLI [Candidatus Aenigmatarchaeota archaeon]|nr:MAG: ribosome biogenesis/translation initiation ATPase RLI [Candidatus Aenigmarchaeota archaeon]
MAERKRIAVIDRELCNPRVCNYICKSVCPINRTGQDCVTISEVDKKPLIDEDLCIGCGICVKKCPKSAISIVNLPGELDEMPVHRYGPNMFTLYRLPIPKKNSVTGLIGPNGVGKSTVLNILSGNIKPNTGLFDKEFDWKEIIERFKGTELQEYLERLSKGKIKIAYKPQHVDLIPKRWSGKVIELLKKTDETRSLEKIVSNLRIQGMLEKDVKNLSGGELQLLAISATLLKDADFYFFDEPSSYLDVHQRLLVASEIRKLCEKSVVMVVEHDLAVADYLADYVHILYGRPGVFGVVSKPYGVRIGINIYLEGYIKEENVRFREEPIFFTGKARGFEKTKFLLSYSGFEKRFEGFYLKTEPGNLYKGEIIGILGPNSIGKTTFIKMLVGEITPDSGEPIKDFKLSYKPQRVVVNPEEEGMIVSEFLAKSVDRSLGTEEKSILRFLGIERLMERQVMFLSGGELQSLLIAECLLKDSDLLLLDEPSAFLDVEQRIRVAKILRNVTESREIPCFIVDHDLQFIDAISDRIILFRGEPGKKGYALPPCGLEEGMNEFLKDMNITFRRDPVTGRPRANKPDSQKDREQKQLGRYYYMEG